MQTQSTRIEFLFGMLSEPFQRHSENVACYASSILRFAKLHALDTFPELDEIDLDAAMAAFWIHDIGKVYLPDLVNKPGKVDNLEMKIIQYHPKFGLDVFGCLNDELGEFTKKMFQMYEAIIGSHHERWDGRGYPAGLRDRQIPLIAQICNVADTYDAITSDRPYSKGRSKQQAIDIITKEAGYQFNPFLVGLVTKSLKWTREATPLFL